MSVIIDNITKGVTNVVDAVTDLGKKLAENLSTINSPTEKRVFGGRKSRKIRKPMKGGYTDNIAETGLAANAAPFSGETAKPQTMVGGKSRRRRGGKAKNSRRKH